MSLTTATLSLFGAYHFLISNKQLGENLTECHQNKDLLGLAVHYTRAGVVGTCCAFLVHAILHHTHLIETEGPVAFAIKAIIVRALSRKCISLYKKTLCQLEIEICYLFKWAAPNRDENYLPFPFRPYKTTLSSPRIFSAVTLAERTLDAGASVASQLLVFAVIRTGYALSQVKNVCEEILFPTPA